MATEGEDADLKTPLTALLCAFIVVCEYVGRPLFSRGSHLVCTFIRPDVMRSVGASLTGIADRPLTDSTTIGTLTIAGPTG